MKMASRWKLQSPGDATRGWSAVQQAVHRRRLATAAGAGQTGGSEAGRDNDLMVDADEAAFTKESKEKDSKHSKHSKTWRSAFAGILREFQALVDQEMYTEADSLLKAFGSDMQPHTWAGAIGYLLQRPSPTAHHLGLRYFEQAQAQGRLCTEAVNQVMTFHTKNKQFQRVSPLYALITSNQLTPSRATFTIMMNAAARANNLVAARDTLAKMAMLQIPPELGAIKLYCTLLARNKEAGLIRQVLANLINWDIKPDHALFHHVLRELGRRGLEDDMIEIFSEMGSGGLEPNLSTFEILIGVFCKANRLDRAKVIYHEVKSRRLRPTIQTYTDLMVACSRQGPSNTDMMYFFGQLYNEGLEPDVYVFNCLIDAYVKHGNLSAARVYFDAMKGRGIDPDVITFTTLLTGLGLRGDVQAMEALLHQLDSSRCHVPPDAMATLYETMARGYATGGHAQQVHRYLDMAAGKSSTFARAQRSLPALRALAVLFSTTDQPAALMGVYEEAVQTMSRGNVHTHSRSLKSDVFAHVVQGCKGDTHMLARLHSQMRGLCVPHYHSQVSEAFVRAHGGRGDMEGVIVHLQDMEATWPGKLRQLLRGTTVELVRTWAERAEELPPASTRLLKQLLDGGSHYTGPSDQIGDDSDA